MQQVYWSCLAFGVMFALVTIVFGDLLGDVFHGALDSLSFDHLEFLQPMVMITAITLFGGAGVLFSKYTAFTALTIACFALLLAVIVSALVFFLYVKPMKNSENSIGFSIDDLIGRTGEVIIPIPAKGCGEILIKVGSANTNQIASSLRGEEFPAGTEVVVAKVQEGILYVYNKETI